MFPMPVRIIKPESSDIALVQPFFPPDSPEAELLREPITSAQLTAAISEPDPVPELQVDVALLEKTAYDNGFRNGQKSGLEAAETRLELLMRRYSEAVLEIGKVKGGLYAEVEREVVRLALAIARKIVYREVQADPEVVQTLVRVALSHVADKSTVTVHLHPSDYEYVLQRKADLSQAAGCACEVVLLADKTIQRGGCMVKTECGDVDARIEERFREVERGFFKELN
jgi:flagellar biosynthesis/type III secretory pathway protein FliH